MFINNFVKSLFTMVLISWQLILHAQNKAPNTMHITFGSGPTCELSSDICSMSMGQKSQTNTSISYNTKNQELVMLFEPAKLEKANRQKLLTVHNKTVKDTYQYTFTYDNPLPPDIVHYLGLKGKYFIRKGIYPVLVKKNQIVFRVKLIKK